MLNAAEEAYEEVTVTIENNGTGDLHLERSPIGITGDHASMFTVNAVPASNTIAPAQTTSLTTRFAPTGGPATKTATIGISSDDPDESFHDSAGRGTIGPEIDARVGSTDVSNTGSHNFTLSGPAVLGTPVDVVFAITNLETADLELTGTPSVVAVAGPDAGPFSVANQPALPVPARGSSASTVRFPAGKLAGSQATATMASTDSDENPYSFGMTASWP